MLSKKVLLISLSVMAVVASGCGKSKESKTDDKAAQAGIQQTQTPSAEVPATTKNGEGVTLEAKNPNSDLNDQFEVLPALPVAPAGGDNAKNDEDLVGGSSVIKPPLAKAQLNQAASVKFNEAEAVKTGGKTESSYYTSAGVDGLMEEFKSYNLKVNAEQRQMNLNLAKGIVAAKIKRSSAQGEISVEMIMDEFGKLTTYKLRAVEEGDKYTLSKVSSSGDLEFQGGFLKCTDIDGGCETAYIKVKLSGAYARVIFRNSYADRHFLVQEGVNNNSFNLWKSYIMNTVTHQQTSQKIDYVQVSSFEVVNGRAGMGLMLLTKDNDLTGLSIPLLASEKGTAVSAQVAKLSDLSKNYDLMPLTSSYSQKLSQAIKDVKLVNNNGRGDLKLKLDLSEGSSAGSIWMVISRVRKASMDAAQIKGFEAKIKAF